MILCVLFRVMEDDRKVSIFNHMTTGDVEDHPNPSYHAYRCSATQQSASVTGVGTG